MTTCTADLDVRPYELIDARHGVPVMERLMRPEDADRLNRQWSERGIAARWMPRSP
jgi:hypothetical protein